MTKQFALLSRSTFFFAALVAFFCAGAMNASAASTLAKNLQGTYKITSFKVILNGQDKGADVPKGSIKVGPTGLTGSNSPALVFAKKLSIQSFKTSNIKSALTSFSCSFTGTTENGNTVFTAGSTIKGTLNSSGLTLKLALKGTHKGTPLTSSSAVAVAKM